MAHVNVHEGGAAEKVIAFFGDNRNVRFAVEFSNPTGGGDACNAVANDSDFHIFFISDSKFHISTKKNDFILRGPKILLKRPIEKAAPLEYFLDAPINY